MRMKEIRLLFSKSTMQSGEVQNLPISKQSLDEVQVQAALVPAAAVGAQWDEPG